MTSQLPKREKSSTPQGGRIVPLVLDGGPNSTWEVSTLPKNKEKIQRSVEKEKNDILDAGLKSRIERGLVARVSTAAPRRSRKSSKRQKKKEPRKRRLAEKGEPS